MNQPDNVLRKEIKCEKLLTQKKKILRNYEKWIEEKQKIIKEEIGHRYRFEKKDKQLRTGNNSLTITPMEK